MFSSVTIERGRSAPGIVAPRSILFWLRLLVLVCVLPAWAMTTWMIVTACQRERSAREQSMVDTARALTQAVDRELASSVVGLQTLATSRSLAARDFANFQRRADEALPSLGGRNIILVDPSGQELINTFKAYGYRLPQVEHGGRQLVDAVFRTGKPVISDLFAGSLTHQPIVAIGVPVILNGTAAYYLGMGISPESLDGVLKRQNFPTDWVAGIVDGTGTFAARTRNEEQFIGKKTAPLLLRKIAEAPEGVVAGDTQDGSSVVVGFSRSSVSGWTVGIGIPSAELMAPLYQSLRLMLSAAAALLLFAALIAWLISSRIARSIGALREPAFSLATDAPFRLPPLEIREVNEIGGALLKASHLLKERRIAREEAEQAERNIAVAKALGRLNHEGLRLWQAQTLRQGLDEMLSATIDVLGADMGNVQILDPGGKVLRIATQRGFEQEFLEYFREVSAQDDTACGRALRTATPVVIEDIELDTSFAPFRSIARAAGYRAVVSAPVIGYQGMVLGILSTHFRSPHRPSDTDVQRLELYLHRAAALVERFRSEQALRESEERLRLAVTGSRMSMFDWDLRTGAFVWNDECFRILGYQVGEVEPSYAAWAARVHPDDREAAEAVQATAKLEHKEFISEYRIIRRDDGSVRWVLSRGLFLYDADKPVRMIGLKQDITETRRQIETQRVRVAELQHRTRNLIAVVQSIAHQTLNATESLEDFENRFDTRLAALSRVQSLLSRADDEPVTIGALVRTELEALGGSGAFADKVTFGGPDVPLRKSAVEMLSLAIHELTTNALKYGALASETGRLSVTWRIEGTLPDQRLVLEWIERGITTADAGRSGYGRSLIEQALPYSLSAQTKFELGTDVLRCVISLPLATTDVDEIVG